MMWGIYAGYLALLVFITYRAALWLMYSADPIGLSTAVDPYTVFYPELFRRGILDSESDGTTYRVLLLGGSVAEQTGKLLQQQLSKKFDHPVRVFNAASAAHTTRDSLNKLEHLADHGTPFDLILVYHGINDVNLNRYPKDLFRNDYSHSGWYYRFDSMRKNPKMSMGRMLRDTSQRIAMASHDESYDWGNDIKTPPAFEANLRTMIEIAQRMNTPIFLMTFANYIPDNYTTEAFLAGELDYGKGEFGHPTEVWGWTDNVRKTIAAHNEAVRRVADDHPEIPFVDVQSQITQPSDFCDVCHFTPAGIELFVEIVTNKIIESDIPRKPSPTAATSTP